MNTNPRLQLKPSSLDQLLETTAWITLVSLWAITLYHYSNLPDSIPTHYNLEGRPDSYGRKATLLLLPIIGTAISAIFTLLHKYEIVFLLPGKVTKDSNPKQHALATRSLRIFKLGILINFLVITWNTISIATGQTNGIGWWLPVSAICFMVLPTAYFIVRAVQLSK
ncbi:DUF1648 domain-containing protein [Chitinophaga cymbidii]|uniref:DUF1648 domain-containing protein n=1 Tax=Chitinophaga cymbidii TaxID=1096750 RepID=A0A512RH64_9BACT|nr:DUF1648 domain-containing protein [Chitinophaga cymbidii]GEP95030.1 hypothetical protein CCY01nite_12900 [Chitinophaga cymbidii]